MLSLACYSAEPLKRLQEQYSEDRLIVLSLDVTCPEACLNMKQSLLNKGIGTIDVLIANAGVGVSFDGILGTKPNDLTDTFKTNLFGTMNTVQVSDISYCCLIYCASDNVLDIQ